MHWWLTQHIRTFSVKYAISDGYSQYNWIENVTENCLLVPLSISIPVQATALGWRFKLCSVFESNYSKPEEGTFLSTQIVLNNSIILLKEKLKNCVLVVKTLPGIQEKPELNSRTGIYTISMENQLLIYLLSTEDSVSPCFCLLKHFKRSWS